MHCTSRQDMEKPKKIGERIDFKFSFRATKVYFPEFIDSTSQMPHLSLHQLRVIVQFRSHKAVTN